jgi:site-specific DNA recombinase
MDEKVEIIKASKSRIDRSNSTVIERLRVAAYCRVSTDSEEQLNSYNSQVKHYKNLIESKENWELVGIYADEAMSGTQTKHRKDFQRMINDAISGKIDLILTKSISRFSRNTLDILKYVRLLKDNHVAVQFEKENINTLDVQGEMLLTILGSLAQAESESISENIKLGFKAKMNRKELIGFSGCLGLDYDPEEKTITINEKEAEIVRYIFKRYVEGAGCYVIARELTQLGYKTKKGNTTWNEGSVRGIVKNEKYVGDVLMQKTFTVDPISKRRLTNFHQLDQYYWKNNHEAIISREVFDKAQEIMNKRSSKHSKTGRGQKYSRKYAFSSMIRCNFCNSNFSRRTWHANSKNEKIMWSCTTGIKKGRKNCPESKHISENDLEEAFVDAFNILCTQNKDITEEFLKNVESTLNTTSIRNDLKKIENEQRKIEGQIERLIDMRLEENLNIEIYEKKYAELSEKHEKIKEKKDELQVLLNEEDDLSNRIDKFRKLFENNQILESFDREIFESVIEKIIVGEIDEEGNINPYSVTFVFSTGLKINKDFSKDNKETEGESNMYPHSSYDTCGARDIDVTNKRLSLPKTLIYQGFQPYGCKTHWAKNIKISLCGNKSIKAVFDS